MSSPPIYRFSDLTLDVGQRRLDRAGKPIELGRLTYALLAALVESAPNVLTHEELVGRVWKGRATSPETVTQRVKLLRDALEDDAERPRYIGLVRGQGYRLIPPVEPWREPSLPAGDSTPRPRRPPVAIVTLAAALVLGVAATTAYLVGALRTDSSSGGAAAPRSLDFEITQLTTTGRAVTPAISPDGRYVVYALLADDGLPRSLRLRQVATASDVEVVPPEADTIVVIPTVSPDGNYIDFVKFAPGAPELWRVPLLGGTPPRRFKSEAVTPVGWSPDGKQGAFIRSDPPGNTSLVAFDEDGEERVLATRTVPTYFVSQNIVSYPPVRPSWSPDGRLIAVFELTNILAPQVTFIDSATGAGRTVDSQGSFIGQGLAWLGPRTLVLNQPAAFGQRNQLWRMTYPSGAIAPLTNDLSSYSAVDLDSSRTRLVTSRLDVRTSLWVGDDAGADAVEVVPRTPFGGRNVFLSWAGERLLYDATLNGRPAIVELAPGSTAPVEAVADAFHVAAAPDGSSIVFGAATRGREGLWRVDGSGRTPVQLVSGFAVEPVVTRDRAVVFVSNRSGAQSPWIVPLDGGEATEIVRENVATFDVSPDGRRLVFLAATLVVCDLPACSNRRELPVPPNLLRYVRFTPDGEEVAYITGSAAGDIWAIPFDGRPPHAVTRFAPSASRIETFGWSRDGRRLALIRSESEQDIVLITSLRP